MAFVPQHYFVYLEDSNQLAHQLKLKKLKLKLLIIKTGVNYPESIEDKAYTLREIPSIPARAILKAAQVKIV